MAAAAAAVANSTAPGSPASYLSSDTTTAPAANAPAATAVVVAPTADTDTDNHDKTTTTAARAMDAGGQWAWQFQVLLGRTAKTYMRNPGNVLVRIVVMVLLALLQGEEMRGKRWEGGCWVMGWDGMDVLAFDAR